jgi:hypothetical protein
MSAAEISATRVRRRSTETLAFRAATAIGLLHALDDAFLHRQPGVGVGQHTLAAGLTLGLGAAAVLIFPRLRPGWRCAVAFLFGALATVNGLMQSRIRVPARATSPARWSPRPASC